LLYDIVDVIIIAKTFVTGTGKNYKAFLSPTLSPLTPNTLDRPLNYRVQSEFPWRGSGVQTFAVAIYLFIYLFVYLFIYLFIYYLATQNTLQI